MRWLWIALAATAAAEFYVGEYRTGPGPADGLRFSSRQLKPDK